MSFKYLWNSWRKEGYAGNVFQTFIMKCLINIIHKMFKQHLLKIFINFCSENALCPCSTKGLSPDPVWQSVEKQNKKGWVLKSGIKYRSASGSLRRPQTVPDWSGTKNRLSQFSGRFQPRSCRTHTDWVPGRLRPPGTKSRLTHD